MKTTKVFLGICLLSGLLLSCSENEDLVNPTVAKSCTVENLMNTPCKDSPYAMSVQKTVDGEEKEVVSEEERPNTYTFRLENGRLACQITDLIYACDFEKINVKVSLKGKELTIFIYPNGSMADCLCYADASFDVKDIDAGSYRLKIEGALNRWLVNKRYTIYDEKVTFAEGEEVQLVFNETD